jgi:hypothetical protein
METRKEILARIDELNILYGVIKDYDQYDIKLFAEDRRKKLLKLLEESIKEDS